MDQSRYRVTTFDNQRQSAGRSEGRVIPDVTQLALGEAREFDLAIMHIDIDNFKGLASKMSMRGLSRFLSIYLTEMTYIVKDNGGDVESYSGDRVTALFGAGQAKDVAISNCLNCALTMLTVIHYVLGPYLTSINLLPSRCAVGMDYGPTWIERVGIRSENQLTLVGHTVNLATQLQEMPRPTGNRYIHQYLELPKRAKSAESFTHISPTQTRIQSTMAKMWSRIPW